MVAPSDKTDIARRPSSLTERPVGDNWTRARARGQVTLWGKVVVPPEKWCPTDVPPGTVEKMSVFKLRLKRREPLFHPFDARYEGCILPLLFGMLSEGERAEVIANLASLLVIVKLSGGPIESQSKSDSVLSGWRTEAAESE